MAGLFDYPDASYPHKVEKTLPLLREHYPQAADEVSLFYANLPKGNVDQMQELFTRSFDVQAITTLDIGHVLFGDDYKRGELLANLNREHRQAHNDCGHELADHLPNVLRLLPKLTDDELVAELIRQIVAPALKKMIGEFDPRRLEEKNALYQKHYRTLIETSVDKATLYRHALAALEVILQKDFPSIASAAADDHSRGFLGPIRIPSKITD
jgi:nitrate reductase assembly molybdenum cofactor insertion protein NarJ